MRLVNLILYNLMEVHPFHSLIVHFPIALTSAALFFILLALWRKDDTLEKVAFANIALAAVSTMLAGLTGLRDNNNIYDGAAPNSNIKIVLASVLLAVTLLVTITRWRKSDLFHSSIRYFYISGYFVSFALVSVLGFLGGVILYGFHDIPVEGNELASTNTEIADIFPLSLIDEANEANEDDENEDGDITHTDSSSSSEEDEDEEEKEIVSFSGDIMPIFESRCIKCHGGLKTEEGLNMTTYEMLLTGSDNGVILSAGDAENSPLVQLSLEGKMPKRGPKLTPSQVQLLIDWINAGAPNN
ncbi:MAG: hypothetical protein HY863_08035 [Chloroflexi bacterium]|nr:hypothetical protein [Chloroflexota bacterium]